MGERVLAISGVTGETLLEWRSEHENATEWVIDGEEPEVLFRWSGLACRDFELFPGTRVVSGEEGLSGFFEVSMPCLDQALHRLVRDWGTTFMDSWLAECRTHFPDVPWTQETWQEEFWHSCCPWILKSEAPNLVRLPLELRPLIQSRSPREGLRALGFRTTGKWMVKRVLWEMESCLKNPHRGAMGATLWASRCATLLPLKDLYNFWNLSNSKEEEFLILLNFGEPQLAEKLKQAVRNIPPKVHWERMLAEFARIPEPWESSPPPIDPDASFSWSPQELDLYTATRRAWSTRLATTARELIYWGEQLENCLQNVGPGSPFLPPRGKVVGLFKGQTIVAASLWNRWDSLEAWSGPANRKITASERSLFEELLPHVLNDPFYQLGDKD